MTTEPTITIVPNASPHLYFVAPFADGTDFELVPIAAWSVRTLHGVSYALPITVPDVEFIGPRTNYLLYDTSTQSWHHGSGASGREGGNGPASLIAYLKQRA